MCIKYVNNKTATEQNYRIVTLNLFCFCFVLFYFILFFLFNEQRGRETEINKM